MTPYNLLQALQLLQGAKAALLNYKFAGGTPGGYLKSLVDSLFRAQMYLIVQAISEQNYDCWGNYATHGRKRGDDLAKGHPIFVGETV